MKKDLFQISKQLTEFICVELSFNNVFRELDKTVGNPSFTKVSFVKSETENIIKKLYAVQFLFEKIDSIRNKIQSKISLSGFLEVITALDCCIDCLKINTTFKVLSKYHIREKNDDFKDFKLFSQKEDRKLELIRSVFYEHVLNSNKSANAYFNSEKEVGEVKFAILLKTEFANDVVIQFLLLVKYALQKEFAKEKIEITFDEMVCLIEKCLKNVKIFADDILNEAKENDWIGKIRGLNENHIK